MKFSNEYDAYLEQPHTGPSNVVRSSTAVRALEALDALTALERLTALDGPMWGCSRYASYSFENFTETDLGYSKSLFQPKNGYFVENTFP